MKHAHNGTITGEGYGYVYVMSYPNSDKVKIGHTLHPTTRAADIGGTLAPETPIIEAYFWCSERREAVERAAHKIEANSRHNGEWFSIPTPRAIEVIRQAAAQVDVLAQLAYDRNEWEAKAAAELAAKLAALPTMSEADLFNAYACQYGKAHAASNGKSVMFTDAYDIAVLQEYKSRKAKVDAMVLEKVKAVAAKKAEEAAARRAIEEKVQDEQRAVERAEREAKKAIDDRNDRFTTRIVGGLAVMALVSLFVFSAFAYLFGESGTPFAVVVVVCGVLGVLFHAVYADGRTVSAINQQFKERERSN